MPAIMQGVRVLEVAAWVYVPMASGVLAEWGADVIKVEHPESGDPQRGLVSSGLLPGGGFVNFAWEHPNRGKRSVGIDLGTEDGHRLLLELAATADVFLTSFLPDARQRLRIDIDDIRAANPDIIYVRGSGNGPRGPEAHRGGYDGCTFWCRGGSADLITAPDAPRLVSQPGGAYGDSMGGAIIAGGIAAALFHRARTGEALVVDSALIHTGAWATSFSIAMSGAFGVERMSFAGMGAPPNPVVNNYRTSDGRFISLVLLQSDRYWPEFVVAIGHPELVDDPKYVDAAARAENKDECVALLVDIFAGRTYEEWKDALKDIEGVWAGAQTLGEVIRDPQVEANGYVAELTDADGRPYKLVTAPIQFGETPSVPTRAPEHGEHTDAVLGELGYTTEQLIELKLSGAIL